MDHETAERLRAPERYVIGELSASERDEFEEHFADCSRCLEEVWAATVFAANAREVFRTAPPAAQPAPRPGWLQRLGWRPLPTLAFSGALNLLLIGGLGYSVWQMRSGPEGSAQPRVTQVFQVRGLSRSAIPTIAASAAQGSIVLSFDLPREYARYSYAIEDSSGVSRMGGALAVAPRSESVSLLVPVGRLGAGEYRFHLDGSGGGQPETIAAGRLLVRPK